MERSHTTNWLTEHPEAWDKIVASVGMEHLGQLEYSEEGDHYHQTGLVEHSRLHTANNDSLIEMAIKAVAELNEIRPIPPGSTLINKLSLISSSIQSKHGWSLTAGAQTKGRICC